MKIILADVQKPLITAWHEVFANTENIVVHHGSIFEVDADALVSLANSFGFMDGGLDLRISEFFGWHVQERLQRLIATKHHGELLVGMADMVATDHPGLPYVISAPTMRVPMVLGPETINVYLATRAVLLLVTFGTLEDGTPIHDVVHTVVFSGMGTGVGKVSPALCVRQMQHAIAAMHSAYPFPRSWSEAQRRHQELYAERYRDLQY